MPRSKKNQFRAFVVFISGTNFFFLFFYGRVCVRPVRQTRTESVFARVDPFWPNQVWLINGAIKISFMEWGCLCGDVGMPLHKATKVNILSNFLQKNEHLFVDYDLDSSLATDRSEPRRDVCA